MQPMPKDMFKRLVLEPAEVRYYTRQVEAVRISSIEREPFLATFGFEMEILITNFHWGMPVHTCATDGKVLAVNPTWYMARTTGGRITVFAHELFHAALGHCLRRMGRDPDWWNAACDHEANNLIVSSGKYEIPTGEVGDTWVCDLKYRGWVAERIYDDLVKDMKQGPGQGGQGAGTPTDDPENGSDDPSNGSSEEEEDGEQIEQTEGSGAASEDAEAEEAKESDGAEQNSDSTDGSGGAGGNPGEGSKYSKAPEAGLVIDQANDDGTDMNEQQRKEALQELAKKGEIGKLAEITSGDSAKVGSQVSMKKVMDTTQNWEITLGQFFQSKGIPAGDTWRKLNRRGMANKMFIPGRRFHGIEWMVFAYDMSYSMDVDSLNMLNDAMDSMRQEFGVQRVTILPFNTIILKDQIKEIGLEDSFPDKWDVGGGTSFKGIFNWVRRAEGNPDGIIVFTDMGSREYGQEVVGVPTLWASSEPFWSHGDVTNKPPFGETLEIERGQR
jgi:predicted metal-dependent peptidase